MCWHYFRRFFATLLVFQLAEMSTANQGFGFSRSDLESHRPYTLPVKRTWQWAAQNLESIIRSHGQKVDKLSLQLRQLNETISNAVIIMAKSIQTLGANLETLASKMQIQERKLHAIELQATVHEFGNKKRDEASLQHGNSILKQSHRILTLERKDTHVWKITNFSSKLKDAKSGINTAVFSDLFYTTQTSVTAFGYKVQTVVYPNGYGSGNGTHLSIYLKVLPGDHDPYLVWPFVADVYFILYDQNESKQRTSDWTKAFFGPRDGRWGFCRPFHATSSKGWGLERFVSQQILTDPNYNYLVNDTLIMGIKVEAIAYASPPANNLTCRD